jgi:CheY-like chemotaxis protein
MRRYLVVDDNEAFAENLAEILADTGAEVDIALSGNAALERVARTHYDLVISDMRMPQMGGAELVKKLRSIEPGLPAIVITAYINDDDLQSARDEGVLAVLPKPAPIPRLLSLCAVARRDSLVVVVHHDNATAEGIGEVLRRRGFASVAVVQVPDPPRLHHLRPFAALIDGRTPSQDVAAMSEAAKALPGLAMLIMTERGAVASDASAKVRPDAEAVADLVAAVEGFYESANG